MDIIYYTTQNLSDFPFLIFDVTPRMAPMETKLGYYMICWFIALISCFSQETHSYAFILYIFCSIFTSFCVYIASNEEYYYVNNMPDEYPAPNLKILIATSVVVSIIIVAICIICFRKNRYTGKNKDTGNSSNISLPNGESKNSIKKSICKRSQDTIITNNINDDDDDIDEDLQQSYHDFIVKKLSDSNSNAKNDDEIDDDSIGVTSNTKTHLHTKKFSDIMREYNSVSTTNTKLSKSKNSHSLQSFEVASMRSSNYNSINNQSDSESKDNNDDNITNNNNNNNINITEHKSSKSFIGNIFNKFSFKKKNINTKNDEYNYESEPLSGVSIVYNKNRNNNDINSDSEYIRKNRINSVSGLPKPPERLKPLKERGSISVNRTNIINVEYISKINNNNINIDKEIPKPPPKRKKPPPPPRI